MDPLASPLMQEILAELRTLREDSRAVRTDISEVRVVQGRQEAVLAEHMRRSAANEAALSETRKEVAEFRQFTAKWAGAWTVLGAAGLLSGIIASAAKIFGLI